MNTEYKIGFIGVGAMGQALVSGLMSSGKYSSEKIGVIGKGSTRSKRISERFSVMSYPSTPDLAINSDVIFLCVKPTDLTSLSEELKDVDLEGKLIISTLAGVTLKSLRDRFPQPHIVRSIPNIASEITKGVTLWSAAKDIPEDLVAYARKLWCAIGQSVEIENEMYIDFASPISGASPAFMSLFTEALIDAGVYIGLPKELSSKLVLHSLKGSCDLIIKSNNNPQVVRHNVTSPGGLTAVCIAELESAGFRTALMNAVRSGHEKTELLGRMTS